MLDYYKELEPVIYGENSIKHLYGDFSGNPGRMCFSMHWHDRLEILRLTSGQLKLHCEEGHFTVTPGQIVVISPRQRHGAFSGTDYVCYHTLMFDIDNFLNKTPASSKYLLPIIKGKTCFQPVIEDAQLLETIDSLLNLLSDPVQKSTLSTIGHVYEILGQLQCYAHQTVCVSNTQIHGFDEVLTYIENHYTESISPRETSASFGYNETYFCRRFKEITGINFTRYIQALRMEQALKLLERTQDSISDIAWKCGYSDVCYFSNNFKKHFGFSPTEFRRKKNEAQK